MKKIETSILIESSASEVWNILMDFDNYSNWNPFINSIKGKSNKNEALEVELMLDGKPMIMKPNVTDYIEKQRFGWLGHLFVKGLFDGHHMFDIEEVGNGMVKFIHHEEFSGVFAGTMLKLIGSKTKAGFEAMNNALKLEAERKNNLKKAS